MHIQALGLALPLSCVTLGKVLHLSGLQHLLCLHAAWISAYWTKCEKSMLKNKIWADFFPPSLPSYMENYWRRAMWEWFNLQHINILASLLPDIIAHLPLWSILLTLSRTSPPSLTLRNLFFAVLFFSSILLTCARYSGRVWKDLLWHWGTESKTAQCRRDNKEIILFIPQILSTC